MEVADVKTSAKLPAAKPAQGIRPIEKNAWSDAHRTRKCASAGRSPSPERLFARPCTIDATISNIDDLHGC